MSDDWPKVKGRRTTKLSPWANIIEREIEFAPGGKPEIYHAVGQPDYIAMLAVTPDGTIPIVRQYRPALESFTWELPAGTVDDGETASEAAARELMEETGYPSLKVHPLGTFAPCSGRLANKVHSFFIEAGDKARRSHARGGHRGPACHAGRTGEHHQGREIRFPAASRHPDAGAAARPARFADCMKIADNRASVRLCGRCRVMGRGCDGNGRFDCRGSSPGQNAPGRDGRPFLRPHPRA